MDARTRQRFEPYMDETYNMLLALCAVSSYPAFCAIQEEARLLVAEIQAGPVEERASR